MQQETHDAECIGTSDLPHTSEFHVPPPRAQPQKSPPPEKPTLNVMREEKYQDHTFIFLQDPNSGIQYLAVEFPSTSKGSNDTSRQLKVLGITQQEDFHVLQDLIYRIVDLTKSLQPNVPIER